MRLYFEYDIIPFCDFSAAFPIITSVQYLSWPIIAKPNPNRTTNETNFTAPTIGSYSNIVGLNCLTAAETEAHRILHRRAISVAVKP